MRAMALALLCDVKLVKQFGFSHIGYRSTNLREISKGILLTQPFDKSWINFTFGCANKPGILTNGFYQEQITLSQGEAQLVLLHVEEDLEEAQAWPRSDSKLSVE